MFNYNLINPVNIHYRKFEGTQNQSTVNPDEKKRQLNEDEEKESQRRFPNGNKVAIDYRNNKINISQILQDFRSTIAAINSPDNVKKEVESYLGLVANESSKENPSREIVVSNLKNAARVTDKYIQDSLKKPSKVVEDWVDALFLQNVNLKADPNEVNEDYRVKIPEKKQAPIDENAYQKAQINYTSGISPLKQDTVSISSKDKISDEEIKTEESYIETPTPTQAEDFEINPFELEEEIQKQAEEEYKNETPIEPKQVVGFYSPKNANEEKAKEIALEAKNIASGGYDPTYAIKLYDEALELLADSDNSNLKSAIYFERGKVFDLNDDAVMALNDYHRATKTGDKNLKTQAHIKMGNIYDDYVQFEPAMDQYSRAIETSEEIENYQGKTKALRCIASMFTKLYDKENTEAFSNLAIESAIESKNPKTIANTYLETAENYKYIGLDSLALKTYGSLAQEKSVQEEYDAMAKNYMEASMLMDKKGNKQKAYALMLKSKEFQRKARYMRAFNQA